MLPDEELTQRIIGAAIEEPVPFSILRSYLKATNLVSGLLLNFAAMPLEIKRVGRESSACNHQTLLP